MPIKLLFALIFVGGVAEGQRIQKEKDYYLVPQSDTVFITTYTISNNLNNKLILWFDLNKSNNLKSPKEYFYKVKGDFSIMDLLNDDNVTNKRFDIIDLSFIKRISNKEKFIISVLYKSRDSWLNNLFDDKIVLINEDNLQLPIKNALSKNSSFLYNSGFISIIFDSLQNASDLSENKN